MKALAVVIDMGEDEDECLGCLRTIKEVAGEGVERAEAVMIESGESFDDWLLCRHCAYAITLATLALLNAADSAFDGAEHDGQGSDVATTELTAIGAGE